MKQTSNNNSIIHLLCAFFVFGYVRCEEKEIRTSGGDFVLLFSFSSICGKCVREEEEEKNRTPNKMK